MQSTPALPFPAKITASKEGKFTSAPHAQNTPKRKVKALSDTLMQILATGQAAPAQAAMPTVAFEGTDSNLFMFWRMTIPAATRQPGNGDKI